jgi:multidrug efflux pump subunit AcrB
VEATRPYEISIQVSEENLRKYGISFDQIAQVVRANSMNVPGGVMRTEGEEIRLRTLGRSYSGEDFSNIVVLARPEGQYITLGQIAEIKDGFAEETNIVRFNGQKTVNIRVLKTKEEDTITIDRAVLKYLEEKQKHLPEGVTLKAWGRGTPRLESRIRLLMRNGFMGLTLVFVLLWLFLDIRLSFWAGMGMPVSIMGAFIVMWYFGATINMMTLFGMITVLGIIVDDAIVVGEAIYLPEKKAWRPLMQQSPGLSKSACL